MSSRSFYLSTLCLAVVVAASPASAQGSIEIGGFGGYTKFDNSLSLGEGAGGGARFSLISGSGWSTWALEGEAAYTTRTIGPLSLRHLPARARLLYALPLGGNASILLGGGGVRNDYKADGNPSVVEYGYTGLAGIQVRLGSYMALRVAAVGDYMANPSNESATREYNLNQSVQAGLSFPLWTDRRAPVEKPTPVMVREVPAPVVIAATPVPAVPGDADRDGVQDAQDLCSNTASGSTVDAQGCAVFRDTDNDGVIDVRDACPATITGVMIDGRGCPVAPDADNDGIPNSADRCPGTRAGEEVDMYGCGTVIAKAPVAAPVEVDTDNDGVLDSRDKCPNTPAGASADASGCTILFKATERTVTLRGVNFATGREELMRNSYAVLDDVARQLIEAPTIRVEIAGHTDATGGRSHNIRLALGRAEAVRAYLIMQGVPAERLVARGYGPDRPIANNATVSGRAMNRRVELRRLD